MIIGNLPETQSVEDNDFLMISKDNQKLLKIKKKEFAKGIGGDSGTKGGRVLYGTEDPGDMTASKGTLYVKLTTVGEKYLTTDSIPLEHDTPFAYFDTRSMGNYIYKFNNPFYTSSYDDTQNSLDELPVTFELKPINTGSSTHTYPGQLYLIDKGITGIRNYKISFDISTNDHVYPAYNDCPFFMTIGSALSDGWSGLPTDLQPGMYELEQHPEFYFIQVQRTKNDSIHIEFEFEATEDNTDFYEGAQVDDNYARVVFSFYLPLDTTNAGHGSELPSACIGIKNLRITPSSDVAFGEIIKFFVKTEQGWIASDDLSDLDGDIYYHSFMSSQASLVGMLHTKNGDFEIRVPEGNQEVSYTEQGSHSSGYSEQGVLHINTNNYPIYTPTVNRHYTQGTLIAEIGGTEIYAPDSGGGGGGSYSATRVYKNTNTSQLSSFSFTTALENADWDELVIYVKNSDAASSDFSYYAPLTIYNLDHYDAMLGEFKFVFSLPSSTTAAKAISISLKSEASTSVSGTRKVTGLKVNTWPGNSSFIFSVYAISHQGGTT